MSYSILDDLQKKIEPQKLIQLTDITNNPATTIDTIMIQRAVQDADATIDSYLARRYQTPVNPTPAVVRDASATIAIYYLYIFRALDPDVWRRRYDDTVSWLEKVAKGEANVAGVSVSASPSQGGAEGAKADARLFSRDNLKDF